jgi:hypothetical protein
MKSEFAKYARDLDIGMVYNPSDCRFVLSDNNKVHRRSVNHMTSVFAACK